MMSRSYWHSPFIHTTGRTNHKAWRTQENRRYRAYIRNMMSHERYDLLPPYKHKWCNPWSSPGDGKYDFFDMSKWICGEKLWHNTCDWSINWRTPYCDDNYHYCVKEYKRLMRK